MSRSLSYGNTPPARGRVQLGEQVRTSDQAALVACLHEQWAASGEQLGGLLYDRNPWSTTNTSYEYGTGWALSRWQPLLHVRVEHAAGGTLLHWRAYVVNADVQVELLQTDLTLVTTSSASCTSGAAQWIGGVITLASAAIRVLRISGRRSSYDTSGQIYHLGAICRPSAGTQIP